MSDVLVLDSAGEPSYTTTWADAVGLYFSDRAQILEEDHEGQLLHSTSFEMGVPRVIQLTNFVARKFTLRVPLCRRNMVIRDSEMRGGVPTLVCQYCGDELSTETFTLDHVLPRSRGGLSTWENLVACCQKCNFTKAARTPEEVGYRLRKTPTVPNSHDPRFRFRLQIKNPRVEWESYLYWSTTLEP